jgi:type IV pilus assembly protein PilB
MMQKTSGLLNFDTNNIISSINNIITHAVKKNASDIHFEVYEDKCRIRLRQDGILYEIAQPPKTLAKQIAARLKIMANLDIAENRLPQDGRCKFEPPISTPTPQHLDTIDIRVNSCPTLYGEKIVLRLLNHDNKIRDIDKLGFNTKQQNDFLATINKPQGLILVTGPTGSGKTVTLYAALRQLNTIHKNISTVEDPIEINMPGINQVNINLKAGLTFSNVLRAFLRQDPDILMIGEIRDLETAEIAIKAAQTGHLVLSTLHTNSAAETLIRLNNMGVKPYNIASAVTLIIAQRLVRKLCPACKQFQQLPQESFSQLGLTKPATIFKAIGCENCTDGYKDRLAVHEVLPINDSFKNIILQTDNHLAFTAEMQQQNIQSLRQTGLEKAASGITTLEEIHRVINF